MKLFINVSLFHVIYNHYIAVFSFCIFNSIPQGLTPHRKKEQRNPRVKHRKKFDKALKKRRSQVPDFRDHEGSYGGEKSGIKSNLTKSTKLR